MPLFEPTGGSNTQVQFNDAGALAGDAGLTYNKTTDVLTVAGAVSLPNGTDTAPSLRFTSDTNTGLWWDTADTINFATGGTQRVVIDESGNVGIGTVGPESKLDVAGNIRIQTVDSILKIFSNTEGADAIVFARSDDSHQSSIGTSAFGKNILFKVGGSEKVRIQNDGNVGIGTTSLPTSGGPALAFGQGFNPGGIGSNTAGIFAKDTAGTAEVFAFDEAGNFTQLSPHDFTMFAPPADHPYPWSYASTNEYLGVKIGVNMARLVQLVERLTGEKLTFVEMLPKARDWASDQADSLAQQIAAYEAWEARRASFEPTPENLSFDEKAPALPAVKDPPAWLAAILAMQGRTPNLAPVKQLCEDWKAGR